MAWARREQGRWAHAPAVKKLYPKVGGSEDPRLWARPCAGPSPATLFPWLPSSPVPLGGSGPVGLEQSLARREGAQETHPQGREEGQGADQPASNPGLPRPCPDDNSPNLSVDGGIFQKAELSCGLGC